MLTNLQPRCILGWTPGDRRTPGWQMGGQQLRTAAGLHPPISITPGCLSAGYFGQDYT
jgi:hypothetical protein